jgi:hypothetical protein
MKVKDFVSRYIGYPKYASDRALFLKYGDVDLLAYYAAGGHNSFVTVMIFNSARMVVSFVNGQRASLTYAFRILDAVHVVELRPVGVMDELRTRVTLVAL